MSWEKPAGYSAPDLENIKTSMQGVNTPAVNGTYLAMMPIVFRGKTPFYSSNGTGETDDRAPLTSGQARTAFDLRWVHDDLVDAIEEIAKEEGGEHRAPV